MIFRYKRYGHGIMRPIVPVTITAKGRSIAYEVIVDSGADVSIIDAEIGRYLGIDVESGKRFEVSGVTGTKEAYYVHAVTMIVGDARFETTVGFLPNMSAFGYGAVGQYGFFDKFLVKFDLQKEEIALAPHNA